MARTTKKTKAQINKQLWDRANNSHRQRWQTLSQKGYDFYLNEQLSKEEKDHSTLWKTRRDLFDSLVNTYNDFTSGIESITQTELEESLEVRE